MRSSFTKRIQNRQISRSNASLLDKSASRQSRKSSHKKYIEVYSKKTNQYSHTFETQSNQKYSRVSLPIKYQSHHRNTANLSISKSQVFINNKNPIYSQPQPRPQNNSINHHQHQSPYHIQSSNHQPRYSFFSTRNPQQQCTIRGHSLPTKNLIIRQIIKPVPINFNYMDPNSVKIQTQQLCNNNNRLSLQNHQLPNKCQILKIENSRKVAAPIKLFSHVPISSGQKNYKNYVPYQIPQHNQRISVQGNILKNIQTSVLINNNSNNNKANIDQFQSTFAKNPNYPLPPHNLNSDRHRKSRQHNQATPVKLLSNESYIQFQVELSDIAVNKDFQQSLKASNINPKSIRYTQEIKQNRLDVLTQKQRESLKERQRQKQEYPYPIKQKNQQNQQNQQNQKISRLSYLQKSREQYDSDIEENQLTITQQNQQQNFKQNLLIQVKINRNSINTNTSSNINVNTSNTKKNQQVSQSHSYTSTKINKKQSLQPKKQFIFV